ncbi:hypothetical protein CRENBAI_017572 [Crenichthys baileyi]|uniref:Uncharacterized protein n=1 Tax=Crenichthys baileyi TaxID=28760 RepID=A0AAV9SHT2_9TELE
MDYNTVSNPDRYVNIIHGSLTMPCLFDADFGKLFEGKADNFLHKWETNIIPKLMKIPSTEMSEDLSTSSFSGNTNDDMVCFKTIQGLAHLLPPTASGQGRDWSRCSVKSAIFFLEDFAPS